MLLDSVTDRLKTVLSTAKVQDACQSWSWLAHVAVDGQLLLTPLAVQYLLQNLVALYNSVLSYNANFVGGGQQLECNIDLRIIREALAIFVTKHTINVTRERTHICHAQRESEKHKVQSSGLSARTFKVDHAIEIRASVPEQRSTLGVVEISLASGKDSRKNIRDTFKAHACSKSELCVLGTSEQHGYLADNACVFSIVCDGPKLTVYTYRLVRRDQVVAEKLTVFEVPTNDASFATMQVGTILEGYLNLLQLSACVEKQAEVLQKANYTRSILASPIGSLGASVTPAKGDKKSQKKTKASRATPPPTPSPPPMSMATQATHGLASHTLTVQVESVMKRDFNTQLFFGTARQLAQPPFSVVAKHIGNDSYLQEVHHHSAAAAIAPDGVVPVLACTANRAAIAALQLPIRLADGSGGVMLIPQATPYEYPTKQPLTFIYTVLSELCPTLLQLTAQRLYYYGLRMANLVLWRGRLCLIDFGHAAWGHDCLNRSALECNQHAMGVPELDEDDYVAGPIGEPQIVYTLGAFLLQALASDLAPFLCCLPQFSTAEELLNGLQRASKDIAAGTLPRESVEQVPAEWVPGLPLVIATLDKLLSYDYEARPSLPEAVELLEGLFQDWRKAARMLREKALADANIVDSDALRQAEPAGLRRKPSSSLRSPLANLMNAAA